MRGRILLINPHETEQSGFTNPPIGLLYIAGTLIQHGFHVQVVDGCTDGKEAIKKAVEEFRPYLVGITCLTPARSKSLEVARMVKEISPLCTVVMGGAHPTIMYHQMLQHYSYIDYIVLGEGEQTFLEIAQGKELSQINGLAYKQNGNIIKTKSRKHIQNLDDIPFPAWHLVDFKKYPARGKGIVNGIDLSREPRISVIFSRGCKGHCDFCSTWWIWKGWRHRSPQNMVSEIELLHKQYGIRHFCFADDALTIDRQTTIDLCDEIMSRHLMITFHVTTRTDCVDELVLRKLKDAGCYKIAFGIETGSPLLLKKMRKENDISSSEQAIRFCKKVGLPVTALLIIGNVEETEESVRDTINFLKRTAPDEIGCVGGLWILPGTKLYRQCMQKGIIDDSFWLTDEPYKIYTEDYSFRELAILQRRVSNYSYRAMFKKILNKVRQLLT